MYTGNNLASPEFSEWLLGMEFHALKLLEITCFVFQPISLPLQDSSPEYIHQCLNHPVLKSLKQCLFWEFTAQSIRSQCQTILIYIHPIFIKPESFLSLSFPSPCYPSARENAGSDFSVITEGLGVGIITYGTAVKAFFAAMELLDVLKL